MDNTKEPHPTLELINQESQRNPLKSGKVLNIISKEELFSNLGGLKLDKEVYKEERKLNNENDPLIMNTNYKLNEIYNEKSWEYNNTQRGCYKDRKGLSFKQLNNYFNQTKNFSPLNKEVEYNNSNLQKSLKYIIDKYPHLQYINNDSYGITEIIMTQKKPRFFVIKSFTEEDIHKSIKYNCWSSTKEGNRKLNTVYKECKENESDLLLFFSMNGSGRFVGVSKMMGEVDENMTFEYWAVDGLWKGLFEVKWIFVKDVPNKYLQEIKLPNNGLKPVTNSRDTQEIPRKEGEMFLRIIEGFKYHSSILQHFQYYDERQRTFENSVLFKK